MPWSWRYEGADGQTVAGPAETFGSQADAESWIGQANPRVFDLAPGWPGPATFLP